LKQRSALIVFVILYKRAIVVVIDGSWIYNYLYNHH